MIQSNRPILNEQTINLRNLEILQQNFPQALEIDEQGRHIINAAKLQLALDPAGIKVEEDGFELRWVGKREAYHTAFTVGQKILLPKPEESQHWNTTGNLLLRGDNLDALRLLRHSYFGKVKLIYIDPPYNTQSEAFIYNDHFGANQTQILEELGYDKENIDYIKNIYGARTHSGWLSFMYPRLLLAKDLLRDDGVIFISIDDNEQAQLKLLCDEVFGQGNFIATFIWQHRKSSQNDVDVSLSHNYILTYARNRDVCELNSLDIHELKFTNPDNDPRGEWVADPMDAPGIRDNLSYAIQNPQTGSVFYPPNARHWRFTEEKFLQAMAENRIVFGKTGKNKPQFKRFKSEAREKGVCPFTIWTDWGTATEGTKELLAIFDGAKIFDTPKPVRLLAKICKLATESDSIILDFFAGSGTTGEAVMRLNAEDGGNRRFILVQIPQVIDPRKQKEAHRFVTEELGKPATIFEITAERLRRTGARIAAEQNTPQAKLELADGTPPLLDTGFRIFDIADDSDMLIFLKPLSEATQADLDYFATPTPAITAEKQAQVLYNLLLAEGLPLTTSLVEVIPQVLYLADDVAIFLHAVEPLLLADTLTQLKAQGKSVVYLTLYAPWINDDNFLQNIKTLAESLGYSSDKLRLRG